MSAVRLPEQRAPDIRWIQGPNTALVWDQIAEQVEAACDGTITPAEVREALEARQALAWLVVDDDEVVASLVTRTRERAGERFLEVLTMGGRDFAYWSRSMQAVLQRLCNESGCTHMEAVCKPGVSKWLRELGWRTHQVIMRWTDGR